MELRNAMVRIKEQKAKQSVSFNTEQETAIADRLCDMFVQYAKARLTA